jgi:hypothetical protein
MAITDWNGITSPAEHTKKPVEPGVRGPETALQRGDFAQNRPDLTPWLCHIDQTVGEYGPNTNRIRRRIRPEYKANTNRIQSEYTSLLWI